MGGKKETGCFRYQTLTVNYLDFLAMPGPIFFRNLHHN